MAQRTITSLEDCIGKPMLAYVSHYIGDNGPVAFAYPRYLHTQEGFIPIDGPSVFPDLGNIVVKISGNVSPADKIGSLAVAELRSSEGIDNRYYPGNRSKYAVTLPANPRPTLPLALTKLSDHVMYNELLQVVEAAEDVRPRDVHEGSLSITPIGGMPASKYVILESVEGSSIYYWGPFEYKDKKSGELVLTATNEYDYLVTRVNSTSLPSELVIADHQEPSGTVAKFIPAALFFPQMKRSSTRLDWLPRQKLVDAIGHILQSITDADLSKNMRRRIKRAIDACTEESEQLHLTKDRKQRLEQMLADIDYFQALPAQIKEQIVKNTSEETLARAALADTNLPVVRDMLQSNSDLQALVNAEREKSDRLIKKMRDQEKEAQQRRDEANKEADEAERRAKDVQQRAIDERRAEITQLEKDVEILREKRSPKRTTMQP